MQSVARQVIITSARAGRQLALPENHVAGPFGVAFDANNPATIVIFSFLNVIIHSFVPMPVTSVFWVTSVVLYGPVWGFLLVLSTSTLGCYLALIATRRCLRPFILKMLGDYDSSWRSLDAAIVRERWKIPLLVRSTPVMPVVLTNFLLAMTAIDDWTYTWTTGVGMIPSGLPYVYAAVVGEQVMEQFPPTDPFLLVLSLVGLLATILAVYYVPSLDLTHENASPPSEAVHCVPSPTTLPCPPTVVGSAHVVRRWAASPRLSSPRRASRARCRAPRRRPAPSRPTPPPTPSPKSYVPRRTAARRWRPTRRSTRRLRARPAAHGTVHPRGTTRGSGR
jgi:uncharacterized membrane protein YdjX (TVP38/TMEM64 family)